MTPFSAFRYTIHISACVLYTAEIFSRKVGGHYSQGIHPQTAGKIIGSASGGAAHRGHRAGALLLHCSRLPQHPALLPAGRGYDHCGHHVLYAGRGDEHEPHGRAGGRNAHQKPERAAHHRCRLSAGLPHHHLGARLTGIGQSGALHPQHDPHPLGGGRRGAVPRGRLPAYAAGHCPAQAAGGVLRAHLCAGRLCAKGISFRGL